MLRRYGKGMEKKDFSPNSKPPTVVARPSMAEEQRLAFEDDRRRIKQGTQMRWPSFLFRN